MPIMGAKPWWYEKPYKEEKMSSAGGSEGFERSEDRQAYTIQVYMDDGRVYKYNVDGADKAREHSDAIVKHGYRHNPKGGQIFEAYGPHRVLKVKVTGGKVPTRYPDVEATGT